MRWPHTHIHILAHTNVHAKNTWYAFVVYCTLCERCPIWSSFPAAGCGDATRPRSTTPTSYEFDKQPCGFTLLLPVKQSYTHTPAQQHHHLLMWHITRLGVIVHNITHWNHEIYCDKLYKRHQNHLRLSITQLLLFPTERQRKRISTMPSNHLRIRGGHQYVTFVLEQVM